MSDSFQIKRPGVLVVRFGDSDISDTEIFSKFLMSTPSFFMEPPALCCSSLFFLSCVVKLIFLLLIGSELRNVYYWHFIVY